MGSYEFRPAIRDNVPLIIAAAGPSGGGKTLTALKIARGLVGGDDSKIFFIDTESGRGRHYACAPGEQPGPNTFGFQYCELHAPFRPEAYTKSVLAADEAGAGVIIVDSASHEWSGDGGVLDWQEEEMEAAVARARQAAQRDNYDFNEFRARENARMRTWIKPKVGHKKMMSRFLQVRAHLIFCLRAEEKMEVRTEHDAKGKKKVVVIPASDRPITERWQPICEKAFMFEMTCSILLLPDMPGVARPVKLQEQHKHAFPTDKPLDERTGELLAAWASGGKKPETEKQPETKTESPPVNGAELRKQGEDIASLGTERLKQWWEGLSGREQHTLRDWRDGLKAIAKRADEAEIDNADLGMGVG